MVFNDLKINTDHSTIFTLVGWEDESAPNNINSINSYWDKPQLALSRFDLDFVTAASAVLAFN